MLFLNLVAGFGGRWDKKNKAGQTLVAVHIYMQRDVQTLINYDSYCTSRETCWFRPIFLLQMYLFVLLFFSIAATFANLDLFDDGQMSAILGTSFGISGANATFDYVVVGGGTAGLTIATRLAENPSLGVAVVEAGGFYEIDNGNLSVVPGGAIYFAGTDPKDFQPLIDWGFNTVPPPVRLNSAAVWRGIQSGLTLLCRAPIFDRFITRVGKPWVAHPRVIICSITGTLKYRDSHALNTPDIDMSEAPRALTKNGRTRWTTKLTRSINFYRFSKNPAIIPPPTRPCTPTVPTVTTQMPSALPEDLSMFLSAIL